VRRERSQFVRVARRSLRMTHEKQTHSGSLCGRLARDVPIDASNVSFPGKIGTVLRLTVTFGALALLVSGASAAESSTALRIAVWPEGRQAAEVHRYTIACAPARGSVPRPARACTVLARLGADAFAPTPPGMACTAIYGGPAQARVLGVVAGRRVDARLRMTNGCEIERWNRVRAVVPR